MHICSNLKYLKFSKTVMLNEYVKDLNSYNSLPCGPMRECKCVNLVTADIEYIFCMFLPLNLNKIDYEKFELNKANVWKNLSSISVRDFGLAYYFVCMHCQ